MKTRTKSQLTNSVVGENTTLPADDLPSNATMGTSPSLQAKKQVSLKARGTYGELLINKLSPAIRAKLEKLLAGVKQARKIGSKWEEGIESINRKGGYVAYNYDFYDYAPDIHTRKLLAIIQVRETSCQKEGYYKNVRKNYFLIGRNEDGSFFASPVSSSWIHPAIKAGKSVVKNCQDKLFKMDYRVVQRQGDIGFISVKAPEGLFLENRKEIIKGNHKITGDSFFEDLNGDCYVLNPQASHNTHQGLSLQGWYKVQQAEEAKIWRFAGATFD